MADQAFALSPSPAQAPDAASADAEYDAILSAFMETTRGRWFLTEYTKRNRNADTAMVLAAVARIEHGLATSRAPVRSDADEHLAAIHAVLDDCRTQLASASAEPLCAEALAPFRHSARILEEIAWGLRESGADGRICSLLDDQVRTINGACDSFIASDLHHEALAAIDGAIARIGRIANGDELTDDNPSQKAAPDNDVPDARDHDASKNSASEGEAASAVDRCDPNEDVSRDEVAQENEDTPSSRMMPEEGIVAPTAASSPEPSPEPSLEPSLGASLIAQGIIAPPQTAAPDPLMAIRRMSHAEKIAFFS